MKKLTDSVIDPKVVINLFLIMSVLKSDFFNFPILKSGKINIFIVGKADSKIAGQHFGPEHLITSKSVHY